MSLVQDYVGLLAAATGRVVLLHACEQRPVTSTSVRPPHLTYPSHTAGHQPWSSSLHKGLILSAAQYLRQELDPQSIKVSTISVGPFAPSFKSPELTHYEAGCAFSPSVDSSSFIRLVPAVPRRPLVGVNVVCVPNALPGIRRSSSKAQDSCQAYETRSRVSYSTSSLVLKISDVRCLACFDRGECIELMTFMLRWCSSYVGTRKSDTLSDCMPVSRLRTTHYPRWSIYVCDLLRDSSLDCLLA